MAKTKQKLSKRYVQITLEFECETDKQIAGLVPEVETIFKNAKRKGPPLKSVKKMGEWQLTYITVTAKKKRKAKVLRIGEKHGENT